MHYSVEIFSMFIQIDWCTPHTDAYQTKAHGPIEWT